jgi:sarcosine oxidase subunit gamma
MSDREFQGYVNVTQDTGQTMFTLRATLSSTKIKVAIKLATGVAVPKRGSCHVVGGCALAWMSPDELLVMAPIAQAEKLRVSLDVALSEEHVLLEDVSDARAKFILSGTNVREVLAKLAPMDTHPEKFPVGSFNRTRFAQVAGAVFLEQDDLVSVICFRSVQDYVYALFCDAATHGSEVLVRE